MTDEAGLPPDLRMPAVAAAGWAGALLGQAVPWWWTVPGILVLLAAWHWRAGGIGAGVLALGLTAAALSTLVAIKSTDTSIGPVPELAEQRASVRASLVLTSDPRQVEGRFADPVLVRGRLTAVTGRGASYAVREPVLVIGGEEWLAAPLGAEVQVGGRLGPTEADDLAAVLVARGGPRIASAPDVGWRGAAVVRGGIREAVAGRPEPQAALVPALVDGDDARVDPGLAADFRDTGLTHLLAVSGTNLTLIAGFLVTAARWAGVRGRWLLLVGAAGIVGFVLLARTEPSVVRAAAMGTVGLVALGANGRERGPRTLGVAVLALLLIDPWLATTPGFALSATATAGIVFLAPAWREALARWLPRWLAEAIAVPAAAQLACTPIVAGLSGQVSVVAVVANLLASPAVGPATVLGLVAGLAHLVWSPLGSALGVLAGWAVAWIIAVARHGAALPSAALEWGSGGVSLAVLTILCLALAAVAPWVLGRRSTGAVACLLMVVAGFVRPPTPGWPPEGWVLAACDVGQGDALVLNAGGGAAVVVDVGPEPRLVDRCLDRLDVARVELLVLTHFHADHVDGIAGVFDGRTVGAVETTITADPPQGAALVGAGLAARGLSARAASYAESRRAGQVTLQTLWPPPGTPARGPGDGSTANNASVVLLAEVRGVRILLTGDVEPEAQAALARSLVGLRVDVLKVPHHGSRHQDLDFLMSLGASVALVSVGADNDYGHPASETLAALDAAGTTTLRTDLDGDLVVLVHDGSIATRTSG